MPAGAWPQPVPDCGMILNAPAWFWYVPGPHAMQPVAPPFGLFAYVPAGQIVHWLQPEPE